MARRGDHNHDGFSVANPKQESDVLKSKVVLSILKGLNFNTYVLCSRIAVCLKSDTIEQRNATQRNATQPDDVGRYGCYSLLLLIASNNIVNNKKRASHPQNKQLTTSNSTE